MSSNAALITLTICLLLFLFASIIIITRKRYGLIGIGFCIYWLLFFITPGLMHVNMGIFPFYLMSYNDVHIEKAALTVLLFTGLSLLGFFFGPAISLTRNRPTTGPINKTNFVTFIALSVILQTSIIFVFGLDFFVSTRGEFSSTHTDLGSMKVAMLGFFRPLSFLSLVIFLIFAKSIFSRVTLILYLCILLTLFLIINYPLALPRYIFFSYILASVYIFVPNGTKVKLSLFAAFFIGVTTVFPIFSQISRGDGTISGLNTYEYYSSSGDFDGLQSTINTVKYVEDKGHTWGHQLLGALFIFIPRQQWESKPIATGSIAAENSGYDFLNISSPLVAEIYIDFGWPGLILISFLTGWALRVVDKKSILAKQTKDWGGILVYGAFFSVLIIILRGPLIGIIANVALFIVLAFALSKLLIKKNQRPYH